MKIKSNRLNKFSKILSIMFGVSLLISPIFFANINNQNNNVSINSNHNQLKLLSNYNLIENAWTMLDTIVAKDTAGDIWTWGAGGDGQNGDGQTENNNSPEMIHDVDGTTNIFGQGITISEAWTMDNTIIAKDTLGDIWSWGKGDAGQNGDGEELNNDTPEKIHDADGTTNIFGQGITIVEAWTMDNTIVAKDTADEIWSWGYGLDGQNGDGERLNNPSPNKIPHFNTNPTIDEAWTMFGNIIIKDTSGNVWAWGDGSSGQNGGGIQSVLDAPEQITKFNSDNTIVNAWTMNETIVAKDSNGDIWSWGKGIVGQNGDGEDTNNFAPEQITQFSGTNTIEEAWTMANTIVAKITDGSVWAWGWGERGQIGDGEFENKLIPNKITQFNETNTIVDAWVTLNTIVAKDTAGDIWAWGWGTEGQNGDGEELHNNEPNKIEQFNNTNTIVNAWTMNNTIIAKDNNGDIWSWGKGDLGQNGDGETENNSTPENIFLQFNLGSIKFENVTPNSATVIVENFTNGKGVNLMEKATLTYGISGGTSQTMDDTNLEDGISFELTGLTEGQSYDLSIAYFNASGSQIWLPITTSSPLIPKKSGLSTGAIIGIAVGVGGAALIGGGVGGIFLYKKKKGI